MSRRPPGRASLPRRLVMLPLLLLAALPPAIAGSLQDKVTGATEVCERLLEAPDGGVPKALLDGARCVAVIPSVLKAAFVFGGRHGSGILSCRDDAGEWSPPVFITFTGGSVGLQAGAQSTDYVLFFMSYRGTKSLLKSKVTLGADVSVAAGPVGRTVEGNTDITLDAEIYSYARSRGLFAGIALEGAVLRVSDRRTARFYGQSVDAGAVLFRHGAPWVPQEALLFIRALGTRAEGNGGD